MKKFKKIIKSSIKLTKAMRIGHHISSFSLLSLHTSILVSMLQEEPRRRHRNKKLIASSSQSFQKLLEQEPSFLYNLRSKTRPFLFLIVVIIPFIVLNIFAEHRSNFQNTSWWFKVFLLQHIADQPLHLRTKRIV